MYEIEIETPKGILKFSIESLKDLTKYLLKYPDYTGVRAKQLKKEKKQYVPMLSLFAKYRILGL